MVDGVDPVLVEGPDHLGLVGHVQDDAVAVLLDPWREHRRHVSSDDDLVRVPPAELHDQFGSNLPRRPRDKDVTQGLGSGVPLSG